MASCSEVNGSSSLTRILCIFCYRLRTRRKTQSEGFGCGEGQGEGRDDGEGVEVFQRFVKMLGKLLGDDLEWLLREKILEDLEGQKSKRWLGCCEDCEMTIGSFCELNYEIISLRLKLEWKLKTLVSIMRLANRVPSRVQQLNEVFKELLVGNDGGGHLKDLKLFPSEGESSERWKEEMSTFKTARQNLIKKCGRLLSNSQPRILVEELKENKREPVRSRASPQRSSSNDNWSAPSFPATPPPPPPQPYVLGWTMSLAAVTLLATSTPVTESCGEDCPSSLNSVQVGSPEDWKTKNIQMDNSTGTEDLAQVESMENDSKIESHTDSPVPDNVDAPADVPEVDLATKNIPTNPVTHELPEENEIINLFGDDDDHFSEQLTVNNFPSDLTTLISHETLEENVDPFDDLQDLHDHNPDQLDAMELEGKSGIIDPHLDESIPLPLLELISEKTNSTIDPSLENEISVSTCNPKGYSLRENRKRSYPKEEDDLDSDDDMHNDEISEKDEDYGSSSSSNCDTDDEPEPKPKVDKTETVSISRSRRPRTRPQAPSSTCKFACPVANCGEGFPTEEELKSHQELHGSFKCNFCDTVKKYAPDLALHELKHAPKTEASSSGPPAKLNCSRCPSSFINAMKQVFVKHFLQTHLSLSFPTQKCSICQMEGVSKDFRRYHFRKYHDVKGLKPLEIHKCDECPAYFRHSHQLVRHKALHFTGKCSECDKAFRTATALKLHLDAIHPHLVESTFKFKCTIGSCKKRFLTEKDLDKHRNQEGHLRDDLPFKCPQCEKLFRGRKGIRNHLKYVHSTETHTCKECGKSFKTKQRLEKHLECHLGNEEMVKCLKCEREFKTARRLKIHMDGVHVDRSHICPKCGKTFKTRVYLQVHLEYHKSPDEWKFQCSTCGKKFADEQKLRQHSGTHTKEKAFICQVCGGQYAHRHNWRGHMKTKHPEEYEKLESQTNGKGDGPKNFLRRKGSKKGECIMTGQIPK